MRRAALAVLLVAGLAAPARAAEGTPPPPHRWVTDGAGFLSPAARDRLDARLEAYERMTGHQLLVWIGGSLGDGSLDEFAVRTFAAWKVGRKGQDDGLVLFIFAQDRKIAIEVGYGLEDEVPDARAGRIISEVMAPPLRAGDNDGALAAAVDELITSIEGRPASQLGLPEGPAQRAPPTRQPQAAPELSLAELILFGVIGFTVLVILVRRPHLAAILFSGVFRGGGGRGGRGGRGGGFGGGGGGGFRGGGGRSGGGGARGGW